MAREALVSHEFGDCMRIDLQEFRGLLAGQDLGFLRGRSRSQCPTNGALDQRLYFWLFRGICGRTKRASDARRGYRARRRETRPREVGV